MLEVKMNKGFVKGFKVKGNVADITSDVMLLVRMIRDELNNSGEFRDAEFFKDMITDEIDKAFLSIDELYKLTRTTKSELDEFKKAFGIGE